MQIITATKVPGLKDELNKIEQLYASQKAKNVEFLYSIENVSVHELCY